MGYDRHDSEFNDLANSVSRDIDKLRDQIERKDKEAEGRALRLERLEDTIKAARIPDAQSMNNLRRDVAWSIDNIDTLLDQNKELLKIIERQWRAIEELSLMGGKDESGLAETNN